MIRLICTNCQAELQIDDAFAGGVCRCQHCGTIQTVPVAADLTGATVSQSDKTKTLFQRKTKSDGVQGSGLDQLADIVASSGLSGSGLSSGRLRASPPGTAPATPKPKTIIGMPMPVAATIGAVVLVLIGLVVWLALRGGNGQASPDLGSTNGPNGTPGQTVQAPNLLGLPINSASVIYLLDRGGATRQYFSALKEATYQSIASLGPERKFQVIFWSLDGTDVLSYPTSAMAYATPENLDACRKALDEVMASGASDVTPALKAALSRDPQLIVLATGKGWDLGEDFSKTVMDLRAKSAVKIDTISLGESVGTAAYKDLARRTGGRSLDVSGSTLRSVAR